jgi:hypothetical protein
MEEIEKEKCSYPNCKHDAEYTQDIVVEGSTEQDTEIVRMPFCPYHFFIVVGGQFTCNVTEITDEEEGEKVITGFEFTLNGPFKETELIEQVMGAREMTKKEVTEKWK